MQPGGLPFDKTAQRFWTPQAPRRGEDRLEPIRINLSGRAKNQSLPRCSQSLITLPFLFAAMVAMLQI